VLPMLECPRGRRNKTANLTAKAHAGSNPVSSSIEFVVPIGVAVAKWLRSEVVILVCVSSILTSYPYMHCHVLNRIMKVSDILQSQVRQAADAAIERVLKAYPDLNLPHLTITYDNCYRWAGWAIGSDYHVNFNPILLLANQEEFIKQIVPHEVAHVITDHIFGDGIPDHGPQWQSIMNLMGLEALEHHPFDVSISKRKVVSYQFICGCTNEVHEYSARTAKDVRLTTYKCNTCKKKLTPLSPISIPKSMPRKVALGTKKDRASWIINKHKGKSRSELIQLLIKEADLSSAGASTYYHLLCPR
jgi:SprT protein